MVEGSEQDELQICEFDVCTQLTMSNETLACPYTIIAEPFGRRSSPMHAEKAILACPGIRPRVRTLPIERPPFSLPSKNLQEVDTSYYTMVGES